MKEAARTLHTGFWVQWFLFKWLQRAVSLGVSARSFIKSLGESMANCLVDAVDPRKVG